MGIYDRDYYQGEEHNQGAGMRGPSSMVGWLILINVAIFLIDMFTPVTSRDPNGTVVSHQLGELLSLHASDVFYPWYWWKFLTYGFAHAPMDSSIRFWHVAFNMYGMWLFGREVEQRYGKREFIFAYCGLVIMSGLCWALVHLVTSDKPGSVVGASGAVMGMVVLYAMNFPNREFYLLFLPGVPIKAWMLAVGYVALDLFSGMGAGGDSNVAHSAHLAGAAWAFIYFKSGVQLSQIGSFGAVMKKMKSPKLRVHNPDDFQDLDREADRLLEKVHREGEESLTKKEKKILADYSRRMRQKHK